MRLVKKGFLRYEGNPTHRVASSALRWIESR